MKSKWALAITKSYKTWLLNFFCSEDEAFTVASVASKMDQRFFGLSEQ